MVDKVLVLLVTGCFALRTENKDWEGGGHLTPHRSWQLPESCIVGPSGLVGCVMCVMCIMCVMCHVLFMFFMCPS